MVKDNQNNILAATHTVVPVSTEMHCENCHDDNGSANSSIATGKVKRNILTLHDQEEQTNLMGSRPALCAKCHSSNALGTQGSPGLPSLSRAIHDKHAAMDDLGSGFSLTDQAKRGGRDEKGMQRHSPHSPG